MSSINNIGAGNPVQRIVPKTYTPATPSTDSAKPTRGADRLELSGVGHMLKTLKTGGDVRADKIAQIKAQIEAGTYEDDHKLNAAIDGLMEDLQK